MAKKKKVTKAKGKKKPVRVSKKKKLARSAVAKSNRVKSGGTSVDGVLRKFKNERSTLDAKLAALRKNIEEFNAKTRKLEEQLEKLSEKENDAEQAIAQLDDRRDHEVCELLSSLGVKLSQPKGETTASTLPFSSSRHGSTNTGSDSKQQENRFEQG